MTGQHWIINREHTLEMFKQHIDECYRKDKYLVVQWKTGKQRSVKQNSSLHLWCEQLADALNEKNLDVKTVMEHKKEIPWTKYAVKDYLFKPVLKTLTDQESSADANKIDYIKVYDILNKYLGEKLGIHIPWPSHESDL